MPEPLQCVYCGQPATTHDHVPPKTLFPHPRPSNLVTVPSCYQCNNSASLDDEYFRDYISTTMQTAEHPQALKIADSIIRSLQRPQKRRYLKSFIESIVNVDVISKAGIYLGTAQAYKLDAHRIEGVIKRIAQGFFYRENKFIIDPSYKFTIVWPEEVATLPNDIIQSLIRLGPEVFGDGVFGCSWGSDEKDVFSTYWIMVFFDTFPFIVKTAT